jgi:CRP/FNR family cyclic AMP-dependent transcriptional regulator
MAVRQAGSRSRLQWPAHPPAHTGDGIRLLEEDDDLAAECDPTTLEQARHGVLARLLLAEPGELPREKWLDSLGRGPGVLILDGVIACETCVSGRTASEIVGTGDLLQARRPSSEDFLSQGECWRVLSPARLALLDEEFLSRAQPWPAVYGALLRRAARRYCDLDVLRAIASHPRLEERLILLLWHLASRWGRVEPGGIRLRLPLTQRLLGQIVAAERPSVSHALTRLAEAGLVEGPTHDLHLRGDTEQHLRLLRRRERACAAQRSVSVISPARTPRPRARAAV